MAKHAAQHAKSSKSASRQAQQQSPLNQASAQQGYEPQVQPRTRPDRRGGWRHIFAILLSLSLAFVLFAVGFFACAAPITTRILTGMTGQFDTTPYLPEKLVDLAVATRDFTVDAHMEGDAAATSVLATKVMDAAMESANPVSAKSDWWTYVMDWRSMRDARESGQVDDVQAMFELAAQSTRFALDADSISHLVDCNRLIRSAQPIIVACAIIALVCIVVLWRSRLLLGRALVAAPLLLLALMLGLGAWAALDFNGFFGAFHALLFPQGNWTFAADSLLICMLPQGFWMGMGVIWLTVTVLACISAVLVGSRMIRRVRNARPEAIIRRASR